MGPTLRISWPRSGAERGRGCGALVTPAGIGPVNEGAAMGARSDCSTILLRVVTEEPTARPNCHANG
ncbi:hypothetical protein ACFFX0_09885 [Citricoccus parietis]|uniref:Uncharacterized protein n=1 Tax=Citricoccus parietis TaxID=592307 RepID=A0ABV5FXV5_9MICC